MEKKENSSSRTYRLLFNALEEYGRIDEEHGILTTEQIKEISARILESHHAEFAYLFGSYARGEAKEDSDVDLLVSSPDQGIRLFASVEELREALHKKVDCVNEEQLHGADELIHDILKEGVKIYPSLKG